MQVLALNPLGPGGEGKYLSAGEQTQHQRSPLSEWLPVLSFFVLPPFVSLLLVTFFVLFAVGFLYLLQCRISTVIQVFQRLILIFVV